MSRPDFEAEAQDVFRVLSTMNSGELTAVTGTIQFALERLYAQALTDARDKYRREGGREAANKIGALFTPDRDNVTVFAESVVAACRVVLKDYEDPDHEA